MCFVCFLVYMQASLADSFLADLEELSDNEGYPVSCFSSYTFFF
jgi:hypothetical protein